MEHGDQGVLRGAKTFLAWATGENCKDKGNCSATWPPSVETHGWNRKPVETGCGVDRSCTRFNAFLISAADFNRRSGGCLSSNQARLKELLEGRTLIIYDAEHDLPILDRSYILYHNNTIRRGLLWFKM